MPAPRTEIATVAVLGAGGTMGRGIVRNLAAAGFAVRAWNRTASKLADLEGVEGLTGCATARDAVRGADATLTMLSDAEAVEAAMRGPDGGLAAMEEGAIWLQASTIGIDGTDRCADLAADGGVWLVDCPVLGTREPAEKGELVVLVSGPEDLREPLARVFEAIGKRVLWVGTAGAASRLKIAINSWIVAVVEGAAEMLALAEGAGIDPALTLEALAEGPLDLPYLRSKGSAMLERDFDPSFRLALAAKDAALALDAAADAGLSLPMLEAARGRMREAANAHGDKDLSAVYLALREPLDG